METKDKGIILRTTEYKDADKLASVFSFEQGKTTLKFVGVKKYKAKFKAVCQPFVFAEFLVAEKGNNKTVIQANIIDDFSKILTNYNKTISGYIVLDIINTILPKEKSEKDLFLLTLTSLKNIEENNEYFSTIDFVLKFLNFTGVGLEMVDGDYVYLDNLTGNFSTKRELESMQIDKKVYLILKAVSFSFDEVKNINLSDNNKGWSENTAKQALRLLHNIINIKFNETIKSFEFI